MFGDSTQKEQTLLNQKLSLVLGLRRQVIASLYVSGIMLDFIINVPSNDSRKMDTNIKKK